MMICLQKNWDNFFHLIFKKILSHFKLTNSPTKEYDYIEK